MKRKILVASISILFFYTHGFSQKSILKFQIGYGLPLASSPVGQNTQVGSSTTTYTGVYGSYGSGLRIEAGYIHVLNDRFNLEMDVAYLIGKSFNLSYSGNGTTQNQNNSSRFYEISPLLRVNLGGNKIKPYAAVGPVFGLGSVIVNNTGTASGGTITSSEFQRQYSGSVAIGAKSVFGAELTQGRFIFYAQVALIAMSYSPDKSEYTKYTLNGTDQLSNLTTYQRQTVYKNSVTAANNGSPDPTKPSESLKFYFAYSNVSLNAGVMFKL
jgi:hypothetical protein